MYYIANILIISYFAKRVIYTFDSSLLKSLSTEIDLIDLIYFFFFNLYTKRIDYIYIFCLIDESAYWLQALAENLKFVGSCSAIAYDLSKKIVITKKR